MVQKLKHWWYMFELIVHRSGAVSNEMAMAREDHKYTSENYNRSTR
jgi:hypothetical protein